MPTARAKKTWIAFSCSYSKNYRQSSAILTRPKSLAFTVQQVDNGVHHFLYIGHIKIAPIKAASFVIFAIATAERIPWKKLHRIQKYLCKTKKRSTKLTHSHIIRETNECSGSVFYMWQYIGTLWIGTRKKRRQNTFGEFVNVHSYT